jgi:hypothetical protein
LLSKILTISLAKIFFKITKSQKITINLLFYFFLPGTIVHELSHFFAAGLLFVRTCEIEFQPKIDEENVRLGSVSIESCDPIRRALIGVAPVFVGMSIIFGLLLYLQNLGNNFLLQLLIFFIIFEVSNTLFSSRKDLEGTLELLLIVLIISISLFIIKPYFWQTILIFSEKKEIVNFFKGGDFFLLLPLFFDALVILLIKTFIRKA